MRPLFDELINGVPFGDAAPGRPPLTVDSTLDAVGVCTSRRRISFRLTQATSPALVDLRSITQRVPLIVVASEGETVRPGHWLPRPDPARRCPDHRGRGRPATRGPREVDRPCLTPALLAPSTSSAACCSRFFFAVVERCHSHSLTRKACALVPDATVFATAEIWSRQSSCSGSPHSTLAGPPARRCSCRLVYVRRRLIRLGTVAVGEQRRQRWWSSSRARRGPETGPAAFVHETLVIWVRPAWPVPLLHEQLSMLHVGRARDTSSLGRLCSQARPGRVPVQPRRVAHSWRRRCCRR